MPDLFEIEESTGVCAGAGSFSLSPRDDDDDLEDEDLDEDERMDPAARPPRPPRSKTKAG